MIDHRLTVDQIRGIGGFPLIYADPPWNYTDKGGNGAAEKHYSTMSLEAICALPVREIASANAVLLIWATYPNLPWVFKVMESWGFSYKTIAFQWVKITRDGKDHFGLGHWTRGNSEPCFLGVRGTPPPVLDHAIRQIVMGEEIVAAARSEHSAKPPEVRDRIDRLFGGLQGIELFGRYDVPETWEAWGDECISTVDLLGDLGAGL